MRIAVFTDSFLPGIGGTENVVLRLSKELNKDHEVIVFAPSYHRGDDSVFPFKVIRAKSIGVTKNDYWAMPGLTKSVKQTLDAFKPDVIHTHTLGKMASYANKYGKKNGIPVVCTMHTKFRYCYEHAFKLKFIARLLLRFVTKRANAADVVTTVSNSMIPEFKRFGLKKDVLVIRNGNDLSEVASREKADGEKFNLLYVGMIISYKNLGFSFECIKELKKRRSDFVFYVVGKGAHEKRYKKLVKKYGLEDNVVMTGAITDKEALSNRYAQADLLLFTSVFDNDSMVLIEAAEHGTPALVLKDTGSSERITDGETGFISEYDKEKVADRIENLMGDKELLRKVGKNAYGICIPWSEIKTQYERIYNQLKKQKNCN